MRIYVTIWNNAYKNLVLFISCYKSLTKYIVSSKKKTLYKIDVMIAKKKREISLLSDLQHFCILIDIFFKVIQIEKLYNNFEISLISLTPPHLCAILEQWHGFPRSYVVAFIILRVLRWEMVVWFVDVGGIVDHHFLIFLFIFYNIKVVELNLIWVSFCNVRYDFRIKTIFGSSLPLDVCRRAHVLFTLIVCVCA